MIKKNKWKLIITSAVILLPMVFGFIMWDQLPSQMTTHFGVDGPDGFASRLFAVVGMPLILLAMQWLCLLISAKDSKGNPQNSKVFSTVLWIIPILSLFAGGMIYATAFGKAPASVQYVFVLFGILFVVLGNYLPKCKQSFTMGIKIKWTLSNEENWYVTHRLAGKLWMVGGLVIMACIFLPLTVGFIVMFAVILAMCIIPTVYSYRYYKKQVAAGNAPEKAKVVVPENMKTARNVILAVVGVILIGAVIFFLTAGFDIRYGDTSFTVDATGWDDATVNYGDIDHIEYMDSCKAGMRIYGFGDVPMQMGIYQNDEFGSYTRYAYAGCDAAVVLKADGKVLVLTGKDAESTKAIYEQLLAKIQ